MSEMKIPQNHRQSGDTTISSSTPKNDQQLPSTSKDSLNHFRWCSRTLLY